MSKQTLELLKQTIETMIDEMDVKQQTVVQVESSDQPAEIELVSPFKPLPGVNNGVTYRYNHYNKRFYYCINDNKVHLIPSVTTVLDSSMKMHGLEEVMRSKGDGYFEFMRERAKYGTLIHLLMMDYIQNGYQLETSAVYNKTVEYYGDKKTANAYFDTIVKDMLCLNQFFAEKVKVVLAVELPVFNNAFAGTIDLVCLYVHKESDFFGEKTQKGEPKKSDRITYKLAVVDLKSGKSGFYDSHLVQLAAYRELLLSTLKMNNIDLNQYLKERLLEVDKTPIHSIDTSEILCVNVAPVNFEEVPKFKECVWSKEDVETALVRFDMYLELHSLTTYQPKRLVLPDVISRKSTPKLVTITDYLESKMKGNSNGV